MPRRSLRPRGAAGSLHAVVRALLLGVGGWQLGAPLFACKLAGPRLPVARPAAGLRTGGWPLQRTSRAATATEVEAPPTWTELEAALSSTASPAPEPLLTLYRDTNGWCPFCERVWLGLRAKGIPYEEVLINLQDKPQWYKDMVPTTLVPAVRFAGSGEVVWESEEVLRRLDTEFPETPRLYADPDRVEVAVAHTSRLMNSSIGLVYRAANMTEEEIDVKRNELIAAADAVEAHLAAGGPFLAGSELSAADCMAVPMLERYAVQLPYSAAALQIRDPERWPSLALWYDAMGALPHYSERVAGDTYSWTAVAPVLMRIFGGQNGTLSGNAARRADAAEAAASSLLAGLASDAVQDGLSASQAARTEAAAKLLANHAAVVADAVLEEPKSQKELRRLDKSQAPAVDAALRAVAAALLSGKLAVLPEMSASGSSVSPADVAEACRFVAARLCAPRDMGAPAADALRRTLMGLATSAGAAAA